MTIFIFFNFSKTLRTSILGLLIILGLISVGCSFPRIIILEDKLKPEEHIALGIIYEQKGQLDDAIKEYEAALKKAPIAFFYLGNAYFHKNDLEKSEEYYKKAIDAIPEHADSYNNLAWLYYIKGVNLKEAESLAEKALSLNPKKEDIYLDTLDKIRKKGNFKNNNQRIQGDVDNEQ